MGGRYRGGDQRDCSPPEIRWSGLVGKPTRTAGASAPRNGSGAAAQGFPMSQRAYGITARRIAVRSANDASILSAGPGLRVVTVTNLKGGSGKSTTTGLLAHAWAEAGRRVIAVDADPQGTLTRWAQDADWYIPVFGLATNKLHAELPGSCPLTVTTSPWWTLRRWNCNAASSTRRCARQLTLW